MSSIDRHDDSHDLHDDSRDDSRGDSRDDSREARDEARDAEAEGLEPNANPPRTTKKWFTAPKFGSASSGGGEFEPGPEKD